jgi:hypothetical protein
LIQPDVGNNPVLKALVSLDDLGILPSLYYIHDRCTCPKHVMLSDHIYIVFINVKLATSGIYPNLKINILFIYTQQHVKPTSTVMKARPKPKSPVIDIPYLDPKVLVDKIKKAT